MPEHTTTESRIRTELLAMLREMPIDRIKVRPLCERAGIGRTTFYAHYDSPYDVLQQIEDEIFAERERQGMPSATLADAGVVREGIRETLAFTLEHLDAMQALLGPYGDGAFRAKWARLIAQLLDASSPSAAVPRWVRNFVVGGVQQMITDWVLHPESASVDDMGRMVYRCIADVVPALSKSR